MARGLLFGSAFFFGLSLVMIIMILWPASPWSTWLMEKTELGDDFCWFGEGIWRTNMVWGESRKGLQCTKHHLHESDARDAYCLSDTNDPDLFSSVNAMCQTAMWGRFFMSFGAVLAFIGAGLIVAIHFTTSLETRVLRTKRALAVMVSSFCSHLILFTIMAASPMFQTFHFHYLGKNNRVNFKGLGCVFQSPFVGGARTLLQSSPMKCLYPGPAFPLSIGTVILQFMGCFILSLLLTDTKHRLNEFHDSPPRKLNANGNLYSLHGAFLRRMSRFHRFEQNLAGLFIPLFVMGNAMLLMSWFYHGMQFLVHVRVHNQPRADVHVPIDIPDITIVELREQVFTFDPVTTLKDFWDSEAYLLTVVTAFWLDFFPFLKVFIWSFYWFVPQNEVIRGRVLSWIQYLGKWSLANLFCLCIISVGFLFEVKLTIPIPLPDKQMIVVEIECVVESGAGITWFIVCMLWTIALGDIFLQFHTIARTWETERRTRDSLEEESIRQPSVLTRTSSALAFEDDTPFSTPQVNTDNSSSLAEITPTRVPTGTGRGRSSLFREIVRRTSAQIFVREVSVSGTKECLCDETFGAIPQRKHKFSGLGKFAVWSALIIILTTSLVSLMGLPFIHLDRNGAVPDFLLSEKVCDLTVFEMVSRINHLGGGARPAYELAIAFVLFAFVFPLLHTMGLMVMWGFPLTLSKQKWLFRFLEFCDAWNALDVFFVAAFISWVGLETISKKVVEIVVPGLTAAARALLGESNVYVVIPTIREGFWLMMVSLIGQKVVSQIIMQLSAATIAQRQYVLDSAVVVTSPGGDSQRLLVHPQRILLPEEMVMFSPAARYVGVSSSNAAALLYAGMPRWVWRLGASIGLMVVEDD